MKELGVRGGCILSGKEAYAGRLAGCRQCCPHYAKVSFTDLRNNDS